jgi:hypothetical protein
MLEPEDLLKDLDLANLTAVQAIQEIQRLSDENLPYMSSAYYRQRLGAIAMLARIAAQRIADNGGSSV